MASLFRSRPAQTVPIEAWLPSCPPRPWSSLPAAPAALAPSSAFSSVSGRRGSALGEKVPSEIPLAAPRKPVHAAPPSQVLSEAC